MGGDDRLDLISQLKNADFLMKALRGDFQKITPYPFRAEKKEYVPSPDRQPLERSTPEQEGVRPQHLENFLRELEDCKSIQVHSIMVLRHGKVIAESFWKPYSPDYPQMVYSLSKSVTGMAVGIAVSEGLLSLEEKLADIFPEKLTPIRNPRINALTIRHLLCMGSGIRFNELGSVEEQDWVKAYMQSDFLFDPGTKFAYNSMNSYLLSAAICRKSGMSLVEYLRPRLFAPLGIGEIFWETCPAGIEKGGWGLYLRLEDMAKLGQLYLQKGRWTAADKTRQIVPETWVEESTKMRFTTMMGEHKAGYGYQLWDFPVEGSYHFNGVFGQYVVVMPKQDIVIALTSGSESLFVDESAKIIAKYFGKESEDVRQKSFVQRPREQYSLRKFASERNLFGATKIPSDNTGYRHVWKVWKDFLGQGKQAELPPELQKINHQTYMLEKSYGSLMPFILQAVHNNFCDGIREIGFRLTKSFCTVKVREGNDLNYINASMDGLPRYSRLRINGEEYEAGSVAKLCYDEDGRPVLKLYITFLETPHTRVIKFVFCGDRVILRFRESPSLEASVELLCELVGNSDSALEKTVMDAIRQKKFGDRFARILKPRTIGKKVETQEHS